MNTFTPTEQNKPTAEEAIGITVGVVVTIIILIMAVIGMLSLLYCFVLNKKKSKLKDIVVDDINITSEENTPIAHINLSNSTTPLYNDFANSKNSGDNYEMNNNEVLEYNT